MPDARAKAKAVRNLIASIASLLHLGLTGMRRDRKSLLFLKKKKQKDFYALGG
jgi:hypothetical protein